MNQMKLNLPPSVTWKDIPTGELPTDVEAFAKLAAEQKSDLRIEANVPSNYQRFAHTNATPSARLILVGQHLRRLNYDVCFSAGSRQNHGTTATKPGVAALRVNPDNSDFTQHMRGSKQEQWAYGRISDRIGALGLLRNALFDPEDRRWASFRHYCAPVTSEHPDLLPRAFMTSLLVRHIRLDPALIIDNYRANDNVHDEQDLQEIRRDQGLYEIMRDQGFRPFDYSELTELALRSTDLQNAGIAPVAEL